MAKHYLEIVSGRTLVSPETRILEIRSTVAGILEKVTVYVRNNVGATLTFDVNKGTVGSGLSTIFSTQADRPSITSGNHSDEATPTSTVTLAVGDILSVDADAVGESFELATVIFQIEDGISQAHGPDIPPPSPATENDEFDSASLNAKWTQATSGTAPTVSIHGDISSYYLTKFGAANGSVNLTQNYAPGAADFSFTMKCSLTPITTAQGIFLYVMDTGGTAYVRAGCFWDNTNGGISASMHSFASPTLTERARKTFSTNLIFNTIFLHLQRVSGTWSFYYSMDGISWYQPTGTTTQAVTVAKIQIDINQLGAAAKFRGGVDWIRRDWLFL